MYSWAERTDVRLCRRQASPLGRRERQREPEFGKAWTAGPYQRGLTPKPLTRASSTVQSSNKKGTNNASVASGRHRRRSPKIRKRHNRNPQRLQNQIRARQKKRPHKNGPHPLQLSSLPVKLRLHPANVLRRQRPPRHPRLGPRNRRSALHNAS